MSRGLSSESDGESPLAAAGERTLRIGEDSPIRISTGHRIMHHDGACSRPHGHNFEITVEVTGTLTDEGWVVDKGAVTDVIDEWDHRFIVESGDPLVEAFRQSGDEDGLVVIDQPPTSEVLSVLLERELESRLPENVSAVSATVRETSELCATDASRQ
ncbi:6-carboxy-5,6,7,8-tetrahydropterin synthase [Halovenus sp. WSH3]|uniref:6-carboxy-5,6,7,8-tetrahydropterin synthase n=1 Tax=Halovenus carboxidivorans TaxID=2692199 RepID=A0A6B0T2I2_9EURY|nr:6-pyruvoyl tetrahydropterin synthase family protein [Halovenus carboxidivorans]MXR52274.1 6-carboxy-5,6,7,8-tetrahydropterin synthase [Halovenus carboxidivorans]